MRYIENPYKQKYDCKTGGSVPTSIGPWPSQTLETLPLKQSEVLFCIKLYSFFISSKFYFTFTIEFC